MIKYFLLVGIAAIISDCTVNVINLPTIVLPTPYPLPTVAAIVSLEAPMVQPPGCHDARDERISFAPGAYGTTVSNVGDWCYIFGASAGQQITIHAMTTADEVAILNFMIPGVHAINLIKISDGVFTASLPDNADYALLVDSISGDGSHQITIEIR